MSVWDGIASIPASLYADTVDIQKTQGRDWVDFYTSVPCTVDSVGGTSPMMMFALSVGATHVVHLETFSPEIKRDMRVKKGDVYYVVLHNEGYGGVLTDLMVKSTSAGG